VLYFVRHSSCNRFVRYINALPRKVFFYLPYSPLSESPKIENLHLTLWFLFLNIALGSITWHKLTAVRFEGIISCAHPTLFLKEKHRCSQEE
jgi:hypothetical protein